VTEAKPSMIPNHADVVDRAFIQAVSLAPSEDNGHYKSCSLSVQSHDGPPLTVTFIVSGGLRVFKHAFREGASTDEVHPLPFSRIYRTFHIAS
jgi:hypothetical protein